MAHACLVVDGTEASCPYEEHRKEYKNFNKNIIYTNIDIFNIILYIL